MHAITQHIADKSFQLVRYYGWYSNKMRGQRAKQADEEVQTEGDAVEVIDVSAHEPRRIPSKEVARVDQEGVGGRPAAVPEVLTMETHAFGFRLPASAPEAKSDFLSVILPRPAGLPYASLKSAQQGDHHRRTITT